MPRYMVEMTEIVHYSVPVRAKDADAAEQIAERKLIRTRNRDQWCTDVSERDVDNVGIA